MWSKTEFRAELARRAAEAPRDQTDAESAELRKRLLEDPGLASASAIGVYLSLPGEPDVGTALREFLDRGQRLALPFVEEEGWRFRRIRDLTPASAGPWNLAFPTPGEPVDSRKLDAILIPGRGFTREGHRIGRGKGIYDRLLAHTEARTIGLAFSFQILDALPVEPHDVRLDEVWTVEFDEPRRKK